MYDDCYYLSNNAFKFLFLKKDVNMYGQQQCHMSCWNLMFTLVPLLVVSVCVNLKLN